MGERMMHLVINESHFCVQVLLRAPGTRLIMVPVLWLGRDGDQLYPASIFDLCILINELYELLG